MKKYSSFIFDMDGTLVHNMQYHKEAWLKLLTSRGLSMTEEEWMDNNHGTLTEVVRRIFGNQYTEQQIMEIGEEKELLYREIYKHFIKPVKGLLEFLEILKSDKFNKALATMGDHRNIDFTLKGIGLVGYFGVELGAEDVQRGKPHPDIFIQAAGNMNVQPYECLVFEDSFSGIEAARKAGMEVVVLSTTHSREELKVLDLNYVINDYEDPLLCELIEYYSN